MKLARFIIVCCTIFPIASIAQEKMIHATVTYISGDAIYLSAGKHAGVKDSSDAFLVAHQDTVAVLRIIATSSTSASCRFVSGRQRPAVGDVVVVPIKLPSEAAGAPDTATAAHPETLTVPLTPDSTIHSLPEKPSAPSGLPSAPSVVIHGRISARYLTFIPSSSITVTQPGISFSIRGQVRETPLQFTLMGNVRMLIRGSTSPFESGGLNQTRIYRISLDYEDDVNRASVGRFTSSVSGSAGYIDGTLVSRKVGPIVIGVSGGFEPSFNQQNLSTDYKKFSLFAGYQPEARAAYLAGVSYTKTFYHSDPDREVMSASLALFPSGNMYVYAQSEVDLRTKKESELIRKAKLTNLLANVDYRFTGILSIGLGVLCYRPNYSFAAIRSIPDSLLDMKLQTSPTLSLNLYFSGGISLYSRYTPRTSEQKFGSEYSHYSSLGASNVLGEGITIRGTFSQNITSAVRTMGYGLNLQKTVAALGDLNLRYQQYRYSFLALDQSTTSNSYAIDVMTSILPRLALWGSVERSIGLDANATTVSAELSVSF